MEAVNHDRFIRPNTIIVEVKAAEGASATIRKLKIGEEESITRACEGGDVFDHAKYAKEIVAACMVEPDYGIEQVEQMDIEVFAEISEHIFKHSGLVQPAELADATPAEAEEIRDAHAGSEVSAYEKQFPADGDEAVLGDEGVEAADSGGSEQVPVRAE